MWFELYIVMNDVDAAWIKNNWAEWMFRVLIASENNSENINEDWNVWYHMKIYLHKKNISLRT